MARQYKQQPFELLSMEDFVDVTIQQLELLPAHFVIHRLTGDGLIDDLIAPLWTIKKRVVLNTIDKEMVKRNTVQGRHYET